MCWRWFYCGLLKQESRYHWHHEVTWTPSAFMPVQFFLSVTEHMCVFEAYRLWSNCWIIHCSPSRGQCILCAVKCSIQYTPFFECECVSVGFPSASHNSCCAVPGGIFYSAQIFIVVTTQPSPFPHHERSNTPPVLQGQAYEVVSPGPRLLLVRTDVEKGSKWGQDT